MYLHDFEYFNQLILQKSFSKVAAYFNVSQPTISSAIKRLENELDTTLVIRDRSHNELIVTPSGQQFAQHVATILNEWRVSKAEIERLNRQQLFFGIPPIIQNSYFAKIAHALQQRQMLAEITLVEAESSILRRRLLAGEIDLALLGTITNDNDPELSRTELGRSPFRIFLSKDHPLAQKKAGVYFADLKKENFIIFASSFAHTEAIRIMARQNHFTPKIIFQSHDVNFLMNMVAENVAITFLSEVATPNRDDIISIPILDEAQPMFITSLVYRTNHMLTPTQQALLGVIDELYHH
ncbi:LysR family transcriptional regulator [Periweissella ghanensis]|uniref:Hydrogen peroxide-inducible genes activator n=1 Tax=Periweissella ghanensis TaxID=467997 RepID=A0ABN8BJK3_9LACO|nr:LysR family transcriptional regulator [Periweissella ghanensis]MCM0601124.1 LysR family transcriptional regulator [Periweissella ghanensis]CAH0417793.1 Hydrogen peroxide-inducible genes activator [Periweissella ghanensis]